MRRRTKQTRSLKVWRYAAHLIDLNEYLDSFPGGTLDNKTDVTELNKIPLNIMLNIWSKYDFFKGFNCESISFKILLIYLRVWKLQNLFMKV